MASSERAILEEIAADIIYLSMEYIGTEYADILEEAKQLSDIELVNFICK